MVDASNFNAAYACLRQVSFGCWIWHGIPVIPLLRGDVKEYEQQSWAKAPNITGCERCLYGTRFSHLCRRG